jgi:prepilin-type N-terminal cleavage/methylation domain-containing protein
MRRRQGFTLVEMLVSMALIIFIMAILSEAFVTGIKTFRDLKALGDLNERLRTATTLLRDDLSADHFSGRRRLSDSNFWNNGPPREGFFRLYQGTTPSNNQNDPYFREGVDLDQVESVRAWNHAIHVAVKKRGNELKDFFGATVPGGSPLPGLGTSDSRYQDANVFKSQWAEVVWFLRFNNSFAGNSPLFGLYRRQRVVVPDNSLNWGNNPILANTPPNNSLNYLEVSGTPTTRASDGTNIFYVNSPTDLTVPPRRFGMDPNADGGQFPANAPAVQYKEPPYPIFGNDQDVPPAQGTYKGADLVANDVLSFSVRVLLGGPGTTAGPNDFMDLTDDRFQAYSSHNRLFYDRQDRPNSPAVFDTWSSVKDDVYDYSSWAVKTTNPSPPTTIPIWHNDAGQAIRIMALEITIRVWDFKTEQVRQVTIVQEM